ncbi:glutamate--tRNA ligase [Rubrivirga sp. S365]|uniref:Glutamate--tRNA ligase n=1 Tax=Rubrivirga litoralis TaxID=3075598 RepID=A0ABU3BVF1_9BACT|nr:MULTISPECIES: glutamate--tRNA ligase [unclassified Rubrivirga]MDT0633269.1 glutamate--tRNA ligase [Rubrivirga sp. F394]MDT7857010.1 glutamate--tRNA ligase [Rubrivirga sp. S365]
MPDAPVRVRFAPSPTGLLHIGGLRTALYNYLLARQTGGAFVLRIEDTDRSRFDADAEQDILDGLAWAGLTTDEGPTQGGAVGPYRQSERRARYDEAARRLLDQGDAYVAFDTPEALEALREGGAAYDATTRGDLDNAVARGEEEARRRVEAGEPHVVRLKVPAGETVAFRDEVRGDVSFDTSDVDDQVLVKSDGMPTYHLANVVDDHAMGITDVIRGEEWLSSVPKHVLLYRALGWEPPRMAHLPLILSPNGGKLSKRSAGRLGIPVSVREYREAGYEPEAVVNFLALLGWNPGDDRELFSLDELAEAFSVDRIGRSGAQFSLDKLEWFNGQHLRALGPAEIARRARPAVDARWGEGGVGEGALVAAAALLRERIAKAADLADAGYLLGHDPETYDPAGVKKRWKDDSARLVALYADRLEAEDAFTEESTEAAMRQLAEDEGVGFGRVVHPARLAVTGVTAGAGMFETLVVVGREATVRRLRRAAEVLG